MPNSSIFLNKIPKTIKETIWAIMTKGSTFVFFFIFSIFSSRWLGIEELGQWAFLYSLLMIFSILAYFGVNSSVPKFIAQAEKEDLPQVLIESFNTRTTISLISLISSPFLYLLLLVLLGKEIYFNYWLGATFFIFFSTYTEFYKRVFGGLHRIQYNFWVNLAEFFSRIIFLVIFYVFSEINVLTVLYSFVFSLALGSLVGFVLCNKKYIRDRKMLFKLSIDKDILNYAYPLLFISIGFFVFTELDSVMLGVLSTNYQTGLFDIAKQITSKLPQISFALSLGVMPIFAKITRENAQDLKEKYLKVTYFNMFGFIFISLLLFFGSEILISLLFGNDFIEATLPTQVMIPYIFMYACNVLLTGFLDYTGLAKKRAINMIFSLILNIVLNFYLIPKMGAVGAALATSVSYLPYFVLNILEVKRYWKKFI